MLLTCRPLRISNAHLLTRFQNKHPSFENAIKWENLRNGQHHKVTICRTLSFDPVGSQVEKQLMWVRVSNYFLRWETASWHERKLTPDFQTAKVNFPAFLTNLYLMGLLQDLIDCSHRSAILCQHKCSQSLCLAQMLCFASLNLPALQAFSTCCSILLWWQSSHHQASHWRQLQSLADERIRVHIVCTSLSSQNALRMKCAT